MAHVILVHGMSATAKSWFGVPKALEDEGHEVVGDLTLPGHDGPFPDPGLIAQKLLSREIGGAEFSRGLFPPATMDDYVAAVAEKLHPTEQSVLIGHSMGGMVISQVASNFPDRVSKLIYVAAGLPMKGQSMGDLTGVSDLKEFIGLLADAMEDFKASGIDSDDPALGSQPLAPIFHAFEENDGFKDISRAYVACRRDRVIDFEKQEEMIDNWPGTTAYEIDTWHIPQKTEPAKLLKHLVDAVP